MSTCENTADSTQKKKPLGRAYTRAELQDMFEAMPRSDALDRLPAYKAYQFEWVSRLEKAYEDLKGEMERLALQTEIQSEAGTAKQREAEGELVARTKYEPLLNQAKLDKKLAQAGYNYLEDRFIAIRKEIQTEMQ